MRTTSLCLLGSMVACGSAPWFPVAAQEFPTRPIRFLVTNAPGGGTDLMARSIGHKLSEAWGQSVIVDNRPGGNGAVGSIAAASSSPDGHTLIIVTSDTHAIVPNLYRKRPYDPVKDFAPVSLVASGPQVMVAHPAVTANTVPELIGVIKAKPGAFNFASPGNGSLGHMTGELFQHLTSTRIEHVPYKGAGAAIVNLLSGYVQLMFSGPGAVQPHVRARKLKAFAVTSKDRAPGVEDIPTFAELGYPTIEALQWYAILTTAGTPRPIVDRLNRETVRIVQLPEIRDRFLASGYVVATSTPQELAALIRNDLAKWDRVVKASGMKSID